MPVQVRPCLSSPSLDVMTFLNEVVQRFPSAISFAPGRPRDEFFDVGGALGQLDSWVSGQAASTGRPPAAVLASLGQYGNTAGLIQEHLARHLAIDQGIHVEPDAIIVTTGCQEAMLIVALGLLDPATDTLLVSDPAYVGITGVARLVGVPVYPVPSGERGLSPKDVEDAIGSVLRSGRRPRALYDVPDFHNPLGTCMPLDVRRELLRVADRHGMVILEDNPYGAFAYDHPSLPTLKALDTTGTVIYLGSFAKTLFPGLRIGYLVADQEIADTGGRLAAALTAVKSFTTINTAPLMQAIAGAVLSADDGSITASVQLKLPHYRESRDRMLSALAREFGDADKRVRGVGWNRPGGGFFIVVTLPFEFGSAELERCAREYDVIVCPMSFFALTPGREREVRLSFSYAGGPTIDEGIRRLACFIRDEVERRRTATCQVSPTMKAAPSAVWVPEALIGLVDRALVRRGLSADDSSFVAHTLVESSLRGIDTHGLRLLPTYLMELAGGRARARPEIRWKSAATAVRVLDADGALGVVAGRHAADMVIQLARSAGVGVVSVRNSNHFGAASAYTLAIARAGLVGLVCSNSDALVAPFGGAYAALGTNPLSAAVAGTNGELFCADLATSQTAFSRVMAYRQQGLQVPSEWVVTSAFADGAGTSGAPEVLKPLGGYKGQCLGMIVEILSSMLSGSTAGHELSHFYDQPFTEPRGVSHFFLALDPAAFDGVTDHRMWVSAYMRYIRAQTPLAGMSVCCPGDPEADATTIRRRTGIPLTEPELSCIHRLVYEESAVSLDVPHSTKARSSAAPFS